MVERAENWRGGRWWIVITAAMGWSYGDGLPWWCWEWGMMKKRNLRKGIGDRKRGAMRNEEEIEHGKRRTRPLKRKCKFRTTPCVMRKFRIPVRTQTECMVLKICLKNEFAQGSHSCEIRIRDFGKEPRACFFWKLPQKHFRTRGVLCENFAQQEVLCENGWVLVFFSPVLPCFHHDFILQAFLPEC